MKKKIRNILITAGPTVEPIDPVRYISNFSTGEMGYSLAEEAEKRGYNVVLVSGPVSLAPPERSKVVSVTTASDMKDKVLQRAGWADCVIMAAAVCDFRPERSEQQKIKKKEEYILRLVKNEDILKAIGEKEGLVKIGFALETEDLAGNARAKLRGKGLDLVVANRKSTENDPFGQGVKEFLLIDKEGREEKISGADKKQAAGIILDKMESISG